MSEPELTFSSEGPINDLFLAINHYLSTGDHVGEGVAIPVGDKRHNILLAYNPRELEDKDDYVRLEARIKQIQAEHRDLPILLTNGGASGSFQCMLLTVNNVDIPRLAELLKVAPGPLGWGSMHSFLIKNGVIQTG